MSKPTINLTAIYAIDPFHEYTEPINKPPYWGDIVSYLYKAASTGISCGNPIIYMLTGYMDLTPPH